MSRINFTVDDDREVVCGADPSFHTFYAQLWDRRHDADFEMGSPKAVVGYHPAERVAPYAGDYGPFPISSAEALDGYMRTAWGISLPPNVRQRLATVQV